MCPGLGWLGAAEGPAMVFSGSSSKWELSTSIPRCEDSIRGKEITVSFLSFPRRVFRLLMPVWVNASLHQIYNSLKKNFKSAEKVQ